MLSNEFNEDKFNSSIDKAKTNVDMFKNIFRIAREHDNNTSFEDFTNLNPEEINSKDLTQEDQVQIEEIIKKNYENKELQNKFESNYVSNNASVEGIADNLATYYMLYGDINLINTEIDIYRSITREEIRDIAKKYLNANQRLILDYVPAKDKAQN